MGVDYYKILKVSRTSGEEELKRSYKKLAMRWHPDKHPSGTQELAEAKFKQICEAYDVLSDPTKRQIYDLYGEDALKYDVSSPSGAGAATRRRDGGRREAEDIFDDFLNGFGDDGDYNEINHKIKKDNDNVNGKGNSKKIGNNNNNNNNNNKADSKKSKAAAIENKLGCTLEELYKGSKRKMVISRIVPDDSGKPSTVEEVLAIDIKPGWKRGTKITFPEKGNQEPGLLPGDLIFVIDEKPHATFKRDGNDLIVNKKISLVEALTGKTLNLTTLDGRNLTIEVSDVVKPDHEVVISGEGMPISKDPKTKGNLRIKFDVKFPSRLSADQKADIKRALTRSS
ncbi:uncharacterized protein LOC141623847 [Silene latifolia]|uniref:uncharacterized protein LOC141623847 n=1 Tax=Silene latifolia TaxID=37657 RepID=UPI003D778E71